MKGIYRENAVMDMSSPEQLNKYIKVVPPLPWAAALSIAAIAAGVLIWAFAGSFASGETVYGVVFPEGGTVHANAAAAGNISEVRAWAGEYVQAGDVLAIIPQDGIISEIEEKRKQGAPESEIDTLIGEYLRQSFVRSPKEGRVTSIVKENTLASPGDTIADILVHDTESSDTQVLAFVPSSAAKNLKPGMEAQVSPAFAAREEYGFMQGYISSIEKYPVTKEYIDGSLRAFAEEILPETGFNTVKITLLPDAESDNLIKWSNEKGRELNIDAGTTCKILIVTGKSRPIEKLFY